MALTAKDRCDQCSARALTTATLVVTRIDDDGNATDRTLTLLFCGHHTHENVDALRKDGWTLVITEVDDAMVEALADVHPAHRAEA